jgi:hypothetical protein
LAQQVNSPIDNSKCAWPMYTVWKS